MIKVLLSVQELDSEFSSMRDKLSSFCECDICDLENFSLKDYDIFIGKKLDAKKLDEANKLKCIFAYKTGVDDFPLKELKNKGITVINSHANSKIIAQYAFCLSLSLVMNIVKSDSNLRKGIWYDSDSKCWNNLFDMKVGLLGYGKIGQEIHKILLNNNIESFTINRFKKYNNIKLVDNLEQLIKSCDIIICSLPKTKNTDNLFNKETLKLMKDKYLVNVGRSNVINEEDLYEALSNNMIKGVAIDTWKRKPKSMSDKLKVSEYDFEKLNNLIMSPHAAMKVEYGHRNYITDITNKVIKYINGEEMTDIVDLDNGY